MQTKKAELTLIDEAAKERITIRPRDTTSGRAMPILCKTWDLGSPDVRYTSVPNPGADGVTESPAFLGARTVVLDLQIIDGHDPDTGIHHDAYYYVTKLTRMTHPACDAVLVITRYDELTHGEPWQMRLRGNPFSIAYGQRAGAILELQLSFTCPSGFLEGPLVAYETPVNAAVDVTTDWVFPAKFPKTFGLSGAIYPYLTIPVTGDAAVQPVIYIIGPVTDPEIHGDPGEKFRFNGLTLAGGQAVRIDMGAGDIQLGTTTGTVLDDMSAYGAVDWSVSTFWTWEPGIHSVRYLSTTGSVRVEFRERRFTI